MNEEKGRRRREMPSQCQSEDSREQNEMNDGMERRERKEKERKKPKKASSFLLSPCLSVGCPIPFAVRSNCTNCQSSRAHSSIAGTVASFTVLANIIVFVSKRWAAKERKKGSQEGGREEKGINDERNVGERWEMGRKRHK